MPTFDFQCRACQHVFECTRPFGSTVSPACPTCSSKRVEKLIAPPAVHFKGSGWYKTDSRGGARSAHADDASPAKKKEEKKADEPKKEAKQSKNENAKVSGDSGISADKPTAK